MCYMVNRLPIIIETCSSDQSVLSSPSGSLLEAYRARIRCLGDWFAHRNGDGVAAAAAAAAKMRNAAARADWYSIVRDGGVDI